MNRRPTVTGGEKNDVMLCPDKPERMIFRTERRRRQKSLRWCLHLKEQDYVFKETEDGGFVFFSVACIQITCEV